MRSKYKNLKISKHTNPLNQEPVTRSIHLPCKPYKSSFARIFLILETAGLLDSRVLYTVQYNVIQHITTQHGTTQYNTLQYNTIQYIIIRLAPRAGKMNQIARCDWLPERARWSHLARSGLPAVSRKQNFTKSHLINPLLTKFVRSRWLDIGLILFLGVYGPRLRLGP